MPFSPRIQQIIRPKGGAINYPAPYLRSVTLEDRESFFIMLNTKPLFIVIEGTDCSGKNCQAELLANYFTLNNQRAVISSEPTTGIIGRLIRQILKEKEDSQVNNKHFDAQLAYLFAGDRHDHLYNEQKGVYSLNALGYHVISTRYHFSSSAYNSSCPISLELVQRLNGSFPDPDLTIFLDIPVEVAMERLQKRVDKNIALEVLETEERLSTARTQYLKTFQEYEGLLKIIDGTQSPEIISLGIQQAVEAIKSTVLP